MIEEYVNEIAANAKKASMTFRMSSEEKRNEALKEIAETLLICKDEILEANAKDLEEAAKTDMSEAMLDRLTLTEERIDGMAQAVKEIADFKDPLNKVLDEYKLENGLNISKQTVPIGSILFIYESRPNVTIDGAALCIKSGNSVILRGGKESAHSSKALADIVRNSLSRVDLDEGIVQLVNNPDRDIVSKLLTKNKELDLVIPRGGEGLIKYVSENSSVPVIKHYKGVCHVYVDAQANPAHAIDIILNAKTQRPGVCNAMETLLIDSNLGDDLQKALVAILQEKGVQLYGDANTAPNFANVESVEYSHYHTEYLELKASVKLVDGVQGAIDHINEFGSGHTESVISTSEEVQEAFLAGVDSASVMVNASTRFADGGQYGLGAEVGISTDKLHARGPMGVESLCSYKWVVRGDGQIR